MNVAQTLTSQMKRNAVKTILQRPQASQQQHSEGIADLPFGTPTHLQAQIYAEKRRFNVLCLGRRCGKTRFGQMLVAEAALQGKPVAWVSPTYKMLAEVWREIKHAMYDYIEDISVQEKHIAFKGGGTLDFWSADSFDSIRGRKYARVFVDEAAMIRNLQEAWEQAIFPTLTDYRGNAWFGSTPKGMNYFHELFNQQNVSELWKSWQMPTTANPYIDVDEVAAAKVMLPLVVFQQEYLAEFVESSGTLVRREHLKYGEVPEGLKLFAGVDLAISEKETADYTAVAIMGKDANGCIYVVDVARERLSFHGALSFINAICTKWQVQQVFVEQTQYQAAAVQELLRRTALNVRGIRPDKNKVVRFQALQARYEQGLVIHARSLPDYFEKELLSFPQGEHDDCVDACAYAYAAMNQRKEVRYIDMNE